eukprot:TCALIF_07288-PA protein Name:"Protein of unknown function" AED:0.51 eAED:0.51 QI:1/1/0.5/1/1/1/2/162/742
MAHVVEGKTCSQNAGMLWGSSLLAIPKLITLNQVLESRLPTQALATTFPVDCYVCPSCKTETQSLETFCPCSFLVFCSAACRSALRREHNYGSTCNVMSNLICHYQNGTKMIQMGTLHNHYEPNIAWIVMLGVKIGLLHDNTACMARVYVACVPLLGLHNFNRHFIPLAYIMPLTLMLQGKPQMAHNFLFLFTLKALKNEPFLPETVKDMTKFDTLIELYHLGMDEDMFRNSHIRRALIRPESTEEDVYNQIIIGAIILKLIYIKDVLMCSSDGQPALKQIDIVKSYLARLHPSFLLFFKLTAMDVPVHQNILNYIRSEIMVTEPLTFFDIATVRHMIRAVMIKYAILDIVPSLLMGRVLTDSFIEPPRDDGCGLCYQNNIEMVTPRDFDRLDKYLVFADVQESVIDILGVIARIGTDSKAVDLYLERTYGILTTLFRKKKNTWTMFRLRRVEVHYTKLPNILLPKVEIPSPPQPSSTQGAVKLESAPEAICSFLSLAIEGKFSSTFSKIKQYFGIVMGMEQWLGRVVTLACDIPHVFPDAASNILHRCMEEADWDQKLREILGLELTFDQDDIGTLSIGSSPSAYEAIAPALRKHTFEVIQNLLQREVRTRTPNDTRGINIFLIVLYRRLKLAMPEFYLRTASKLAFYYALVSITSRQPSLSRANLDLMFTCKFEDLARAMAIREAKFEESSGRATLTLMDENGVARWLKTGDMKSNGMLDPQLTWIDIWPQFDQEDDISS